MHSVHLAIAAIPIAIYLILIGGLRLRTHPLVTTGWRDTLTLGIASSGLIAIGPIQLFFPTDAAARWHGWVWLALFLLYVLGLMLVLISCKPRLLAYGITEIQFREMLLQAALEVDPTAHWQAEVLNLPACAIQLANDPSGSSRVQQVVHVGMLHNLPDWLRLEKAFAAAGAKVTCQPSLAGWPFVLTGSIILILAIGPMINDPSEALAQLREFLAR